MTRGPGPVVAITPAAAISGDEPALTARIRLRMALESAWFDFFEHLGEDAAGRVSISVSGHPALGVTAACQDLSDARALAAALHLGQEEIDADSLAGAVHHSWQGQHGTTPLRIYCIVEQAVTGDGLP